MLDNKDDGLTDELKTCLKGVVDDMDKEDRFVRERQLRTCKKYKYYWNGFTRIWWQETAHDWRVFDLAMSPEASTYTGDASFYDKPINVFRAYLESIIAALSVSIPSIKC